MRIDPSLAETLRIVAEQGTLEAAARHLHMTPSATSRWLTPLERRPRPISGERSDGSRSERDDRVRRFGLDGPGA